MQARLTTLMCSGPLGASCQSLLHDLYRSLQCALGCTHCTALSLSPTLLRSSFPCPR